MTDDTAHFIMEYRENARRMRALANSVRSSQESAEFERIARELENWADQEVARIAGRSSK